LPGFFLPENRSLAQNKKLIEISATMPFLAKHRVSHNVGAIPASRYSRVNNTAAISQEKRQNPEGRLILGNEAERFPDAAAYNYEDARP